MNCLPCRTHWQTYFTVPSTAVNTLSRPLMPCALSSVRLFLNDRLRRNQPVVHAEDRRAAPALKPHPLDLRHLTAPAFFALRNYHRPGRLRLSSWCVAAQASGAVAGCVTSADPAVDCSVVHASPPKSKTPCRSRLAASVTYSSSRSIPIALQCSARAA